VLQPKFDASATALLTAMERAARVAAQFLAERSEERGELAWRAKGRHDFVSDVDTGAERLIRDALLSAHPEAHIVGEELSPDTGALKGLTFLVDPLDGTTNFLHGYPWYAVSIAALSDDRLGAATILNVPSGDLFTAVAGGGAFRNTHPITVSAIAEAERALIGTGFPFKKTELLPQYLRQFDVVSRRTAGIRRAGSAALDLADVACGRFEAFWELDLAPWDFAAGVLLVREAGGVVTDVGGDDVSWRSGSILAGNRVMHRWLLDTLRVAA